LEGGAGVMRIRSVRQYFEGIEFWEYRIDLVSFNSTPEFDRKRFLNIINERGRNNKFTMLEKETDNKTNELVLRFIPLLMIAEWKKKRKS
jgi:hypothetical protein